MTRQTRCIDCNKVGRTTPRPAPNPGPRCGQCWRVEKHRRALEAHGHRVEKHFGITGEQYWVIYEAQDGRCAVCRKASGRTKRLAVDHDHKLCDDHPPEMGCPRCVRALLCGPCNKMLGHLDVEALQRAIEVLSDPPAQKILQSLRRPV